MAGTHGNNEGGQGGEWYTQKKGRVGKCLTKVMFCFLVCDYVLQIYLGH